MPGPIISGFQTLVYMKLVDLALVFTVMFTRS